MRFILKYITLQLIFILLLPCKVFALQSRTTEDLDILYDKVWFTYTREQKLDYLLTYLNDMNNDLGLLGDNAIPAERVILMPENSIWFNKTTGCYLRNGYIYLRLTTGWGADNLRTLAHEMRHAYQDAYDRLIWETDIYTDHMSYTKNVREMDANVYALQYVEKLLAYNDYKPESKFQSNFK